MKENIMMDKVLVTGHNGFIGKHLVKALKEKEFDVITLENRIEEKNYLYQIPKDIRAIFHLAAFLKDYDDIEKNNLINGFAMEKLASFCADHKIKFICSSSASVYGFQSRFPINENALLKPDNPYSISKLLGECYCNLYIKKRNLNCIILRYSSVYGFGMKGNTVLPIFVNNAKAEKDLIVYGNGNRFQDFVYIDDIIQANLKAFYSNKKGIYNIGCGIKTSMIDLANKINKVFSNDKLIIDRKKEDKSPNMWLDISKAIKDLKYNPKYDLEKGLKELKLEEQIKQIKEDFEN